MEKTEKDLLRFGLLGKNISYSFSRGYFNEKFKALKLEDHRYENFDIESIEKFNTIVENTPNLKGLNVTIPYKEAVIPFLDELEPSAKIIGAVNTIKVEKGKLTGYNTDAYGFQKSLEPFLKKQHKKALILGTGGASKAIAFILKELNISYRFVSRSGKNSGFTYEALNPEIMSDYLLIINCSPLGTFPNIEDKPQIPYETITQDHLFFDLIYNPEKTTFLKEGEIKGATICNGLKMLELQAEKSWEIWNS
ncbi:shikimate dehydrogenase family protein [Maribacter sp. 2210JD10-5]|uniref:shikimate dehydrogenase family protein n=1 Tax=Maribacter sp. 2210JD10-5 TaxID=3386272 RepID=UPI0039BC25FB